MIKSFRQFQRPGWTISTVAIALLVSLPVFVVFSYWLQPGSDTWSHLVDTVLTDYVVNSLLLMLGVTLCTGVIGTTTAWIIAQYRFPAHKFVRTLLILPLAFPGYIVSFAYAGMLDYAGPVQTTIRTVFGFATKRDYWFPDIMSLGGAVVVLSLVLYPYVYLITLPVFEHNTANLQEVAKTFGYSGWRRFFKISLPLARPAIVGGTSLALMEALNNFGTVQYYGVSTFTTGIYRTWFSLGDLPSAARLSGILLIFVLTLFFVEQWQRRKIKVVQGTISGGENVKDSLTGIRKWSAFIVCLIPALLGFIIPFVQLGYWAVINAAEVINETFYTILWNSLSLAIGVAGLIMILALILVYAARITENRYIRLLSRVATMGYAVPGSVISVGILIPLAWFDNSLDSFMEQTFGISTGLLLSGTIIAVSVGYIIRFLAVAYNSVQAGFGRVPIELDQTSTSLGCSPSRTLWKVHLPLVRKSLIAAVLIGFIDIMKELPATLILRPFNFDTLATKAYELAAEEMLPHAAVYAICIVLAGLIPVIFLNHLTNKEKK